MNMKKIAILALSLCMVAAIAITGTIAYFTDTAEATNTFTIGSVDIDLLESQLHRDNTDATDDEIRADAATYQEKYLAVKGENIVPGAYILKAPYIDNVGDNAAYVRVGAIVTKEFDSLFYVMEYTTAQEEGEISNVVTSFCDADGNEVADEDEATHVKMVWTYLNPVLAGTMTYYAPFWQFCLAPDLDNDDVANLDAEDTTIKVYAEAIQAEGFKTAAEAFAMYESETQGKTWSRNDTISKDLYEEPTAPSTTPDTN